MVKLLRFFTLSLLIGSSSVALGREAPAVETTQTQSAKTQGTTKSATELNSSKNAAQTEKKQEDIVVTMKTNLGEMVIQLYPSEAPKTVKNFLEYVDNGFYEGVIFHRVVPNFVVQAGGFDTRFNRKRTAPPVINESNNGLKNERGTLSMARTNHPHSGTSQFFINLVNNQSLDWRPGNPGYAVFGKVVKGLSVIDSMALLEQGKYMGAFQNAPNEAVIIEKVYRNKPNTPEKTKK